MKAKASNPEARFAYEGLDRVIHERARLSVLTSLVTHPKVWRSAISSNFAPLRRQFEPSSPRA